MSRYIMTDVRIYTFLLFAISANIPVKNIIHTKTNIMFFIPNNRPSGSNTQTLINNINAILNNLFKKDLSVWAFKELY